MRPLGWGRSPSHAPDSSKYVSDEIEQLLRRDGPLPIGRIRSHLYGRFIGHSSADAVIAQNAHRFIRQPNGTVSLRTDDAPVATEVPAGPATPKRTAFWQRR